MITLSTLNQAHQALMGQAHGLPLPLRYAGIVPETEAMVGGLALLDLESCGVMLLKGAQAGKFLNGLLTNDIATLAVGGVGAGFLCGPKGKVLFSLTAARIKPDEYLAVTDPGALEAVAAHMDFYHVREEVELGRVGLTRLELFGPLARSALDGLNIPSGGEPGRFQDQPVLAYPLPFGTLPRWMVLAAAPVAGGLAQALL
ncbi:MAG: hypothetical protein OEW12_07930, partial [Deltaproteobacteria bacterium]|nr:hypothetical protein [Deltaproteobacteria bacterium]